MGRTGPVQSEPFEFLCILCPVVSVSSGGVGFVCGMKRGICLSGVATSGFVLVARRHSYATVHGSLFLSRA